MALLKAIVSLYRIEEKPIERYKTRVKVAEENKLFSSFQKNIIGFLGLNKQAFASAFTFNHGRNPHC